jgi:hypothetical protein
LPPIELMLTIRPEPCAHVRRHQLGQPGEPEDVHVELTPGLVERHVLDRAVRAVTGVVDQDVDPPLLLDDPGDAGNHRGIVCDVHREHMGALLGQ